MNTEIGQSLQGFEGQARYFRQALRALPNPRGYAPTEVGELAGVSLIRGVAEATDGRRFEAEEFGRGLLARIAPFVPTLTQSWKSEPIAKVPEMPVDPVTGERPPNPFLDDTPAGKRAQAELRARKPELAAHLERWASDQWGAIFAAEDAAQRRAELAAISYTAKDHETNPWRLGDVDAQSLFAATQPRLVTEVWKFEAQPIQLPWSSDSQMIQRTIQGQILQALDAQPWEGVTGNVILRAAQIDAALANKLALASRR